MIKKLAAILACLVLLAGCQSSVEPETVEDTKPTADPLTGQEWTWEGERPVAVSISGNSEAVRYGLKDASLVLEALTEGEQETSLCFVYPSAKAVPTVGPVAQCQDLYLQLLSPQKILPVYRGAGRYAANYLDQFDLDGIDGHIFGKKAFEYSGTWDTPDEVSWYTSGSLLTQTLAEKGWSSKIAVAEPIEETEEEQNVAAFLPPVLPFGAEEPESEATEENTSGQENGQEGVARAELTFSAQSGRAFVYDENLGQYRMTESDGSATVDTASGEAVAFDNVLVLFSAPTLREDGYTWDYDLSMGGGIYLSGGKAWSILWMPGTESTLAIYRSDGTPLNITPGRSYLAMLSNQGSEGSQKVVLKNKAGAQVPLV